MAGTTKRPEGEQSESPVAKPDIATIAGLILAAAGILGGLLLEKGNIRDVAQITAAVIVLGGTVGATLVNTPLPVIERAVRRLRSVFFVQTMDPAGMVEEIVGYANKARKNGLVSLEREALSISDPFLAKALNLAVDGTDLHEIRKMLELEIGLEEQQGEAEVRVFESAGGYSPTIGIIGAVLGLIQVMKNLANIDEVGHGIAVAFVATVYGVALANVFLLPAASKIRARIQTEIQRKELILEGVLGIVEGLNPKLIRSKLEAYARSAAVTGKPSDAPSAKETKAGKDANATGRPVGAEG